MNQQPQRDHWIGFDLGGTKMLSIVYDDQFEEVGRKRAKTKAHAGVDASLDRIVATIRKSLDAAEIEPDRLGGIGVGCPGPLDLDKGLIIASPNLGWENIHLKKLLEDQFGCPATIANDVDAGVFGEYRFGAAVGHRCVLGVFPGTGVGGGAVYEGKIVRGKTGSCMEIGHVQVIPDGPLCGCGQHGCLEAVASRLAISSAAAQAAFRGQAPYLSSTAGMDLREVRSGALASSIKAGDEVVERIVRDAAQFIGVAVAGVVHLLAPDVVVLGGGLVEAMPEVIVPEVEKSAKSHVMPAYVDTFEVVEAALGDDATVKGAAAWGREAVEAA